MLIVMQRTLRLAAFVLAAVLPAVSVADWGDLMRGNARYVEGVLQYNRLKEQRKATREHQHPPTTVLSCADSRVPPELVFDQSVGDLFVIRVAGNVADQFSLASIEYAVANGYTQMIVVLGHENCGAVKAALSGDAPGSPSLTALVNRIRMNLGGRRPPVREAVETNARASATHLLQNSKIIRDAVDRGKVTIVTAYYSFDGRVQRLD